MKQLIQAELNQLTSIQNGADLYRAYFRIAQVFTAIGAIYSLGMSFVMMRALPFEGQALVQPTFLLSTVGLCVFYAIALELSLRAVDAGKFSGVLVGLLSALFIIPGWYFWMGLFGVYCFLNKDFQQKKLGSAPKWFLDFLSALNLNYTTASQILDP